MTVHSRRVLLASVWGTISGGLVGFGLGMLLAPDEGQQMRRRLAYLLDRWSGQVSVMVERLRTEDSESDARASAAAIVDDARQQAEKLLQEADDLMNEVRRGHSG